MTRRWFQLKFQTTLADYVRAITWSPQSNDLAASSAAGEICLWDGKQCLHLAQATGQSMDSVGFSHDGQWLAAAGQSGQVLLWNLSGNEWQLVSTLEHPAIWIDHLAWSPSECLLAYGVNREVKIWDVRSQSIIATLDFAASSVFDVTWHPQGKRLAVCGHGGVKVWQREDWSQEPDLLEVPGASLTASWSANGQYLASGNLDRTLSVMEWEHPPPWLMQGFPGKVSQIAWSHRSQPNGSPLLASTSLDGIAVWQRPDSADQWQNQVLEQHQGFIQAIAFQPSFSPDQALLASAGSDGHLHLWEKAQKRRHTLKGVTNGFSCLAWHPNGKQLAVGGQAGELMLWQAVIAGKGFAQ